MEQKCEVLVLCITYELLWSFKTRKSDQNCNRTSWSHADKSIAETSGWRMLSFTKNTNKLRWHDRKASALGQALILKSRLIQEIVIFTAIPWDQCSDYSKQKLTNTWRAYRYEGFALSATNQFSLKLKRSSNSKTIKAYFECYHPVSKSWVWDTSANFILLVTKLQVTVQVCYCRAIETFKLYKP